MQSPRGPRTRTHKADPTYRDVLKRLAANLRRLRQERAWNQEEAAHQCKLATRLLQRIEAEDANFTIVTLARIADGFEIDPQLLLRPITKSPTPLTQSRPASSRPRRRS